MTVILKPTAFPPVAVQMTGVAPSGKKDPDAGLHETVPQVSPIAGPRRCAVGDDRSGLVRVVADLTLGWLMLLHTARASGGAAA